MEADRRHVVLDVVRTRAAEQLAFRDPDGQVLIGDLVHGHVRRNGERARASGPGSEERDTRDDLVRAAGERLEHPARVVHIDRLAEYGAVGHHDRVECEHERAVTVLFASGSRLLGRDRRRELRRERGKRIGEILGGLNGNRVCPNTEPADEPAAAWRRRCEQEVCVSGFHAGDDSTGAHLGA